MLGIAPLVTPLAAGGAAPSPGSVVPPVVILVMCLAAGVGTVMMLPSRRETPVRKMGAAVVVGAALILAALLVHKGAQSGGGGGMGLYFWIFSAVALLGALRVVTHTRPVYSALYFVLTVFATAGLFILLWAEFMAAALVLIYAGAILVTYVFVIMLASTAAPAPGTGSGARAASDSPADGDGVSNGDGDTAARYESSSADGPAAARPSLAGLADEDAVSREPLIAAAVGFALMGVLLFVIFDRAGERVRPVDRDPATGRIVDPALIARLQGRLPSPDEPVAEGPTQELGAYLFQNHVVNLELAGLLLTVSMVGAIVIARRRIYAAETIGGIPRDDLGPAQDVFNAPMTPIDDNPHSIPVYGTENPRQKAYPET
jgi:NADH-quinone oxidoreductase subunit J